MMNNEFLKVDLLDWVYGTIQKVQNGEEWSDAWLSTYFEIGGSSLNSGSKGCPKNALRILYQTGRLKNTELGCKNYNLQKIWEDSKNGVYALITTEVLSENESIEYEQLKDRVYAETASRFGSAPKSDQGAVRLTLMLWKLGKVQC